LLLLLLAKTSPDIAGNFLLWYSHWKKLMVGLVSRNDVCGDLGNRWCVAAFMLGRDFNPTGPEAIANPGVNSIFDSFPIGSLWVRVVVMMAFGYRTELHPIV
jgi:hypothetical protein